MTGDDTETNENGERVPLTDWAAVECHLGRFVGDGRLVEREDGALACEFGGVTHLTVHPDGRVETAMPLHEFAAADVEALAFDHGRGTVRVTADANGGSVSYVFRRP